MAGFSLVEMLVFVAIISCVAAAAFMLVSNLHDTAASVKFQRNVASLNQAIRSYQVNGGTIPDSATGDQVITLLKCPLSGADAAVHTGLRGASVDRRLRGVISTSSGEPRAVYDATSRRFVIASTGSGFSDFALDDTSAVAEAAVGSRGGPTKFSDGGNWVWNFNEAGAASGGPTVSPAVEPRETEEPPSPDLAISLAPPAFSIPGDIYDASLFRPTLPLTLSDPNPAGAATIYYSVAGGPWLAYTGTIGIPAELATTVQAYAASTEPDSWSDSLPRTEKYGTIWFSGDSAGLFHTPVGDARLVSSIGPGQKSDTFTWGTPVPATNPNKLEFKGAHFDRVKPDEEFELGKLTYFNGSTYSGTNATSVQIEMDLKLTVPGVTERLNFTFKLLSTPNNGRDPDADADYVYIPDVSTSFSTTIAGRKFYLVLRFGDHGTNGFTTIDTFHTHEGKTMKGVIIGKLTTNPP